MLRELLNIILPIRLSFGGGGGGDNSDEIREQERQREADMLKSSREINSIFGIFDPANFDESGKLKAKTPETIDFSNTPYPGLTPEQQNDYSRLQGLITNFDDYDSGSGTSSLQAWQNQLANYDNIINQTNAGTLDPMYGKPEFGGLYGSDNSVGLPSDPFLAEQAYQNRQSIDANYNKNYGDIMNFFTHGLGEQLQKSTQENTYDLARKGLLRGSEDIQAEAKRTRRYDDALLDLTNEADTSINTLRSNDEQARLNLLSSIRAGMDQESAIAGATNALRNNANLAANQAKATQFTGVFDDLNNLYKAGVYTQGAQQGINNPYQSRTWAPGSNPPARSGTIFSS